MGFNSETGAKAGKKSKRTKNKTTLELQESFNSILSDNLENMNTWLNEIATKQPEKALEMTLKIASFILPKVRSIEVDLKEPKEDLTKLSNEELEERLRQARRINMTPIEFIKT